MSSRIKWLQFVRSLHCLCPSAPRRELQFRSSPSAEQINLRKGSESSTTRTRIGDVSKESPSYNVNPTLRLELPVVASMAHSAIQVDAQAHG